MEQERKIEYQTLQSLSMHPLNAILYSENCCEDDEELKESIKEKGIITPLLVTKVGVIISGHRRYNAAKALDFKEVPIIVSEVEDNLEIEELLIFANRQRVKTPEQIAREYIKLKEIEAKKAKKRQEQAGRTHKKELVPNSAQAGKAREKAAKAVGIKRDKAEKAAKVVAKIDELKFINQEEAEQLRDTLNKKSVHAAYRKIFPITESASPTEEITTPAEEIVAPTEENWKKKAKDLEKENVSLMLEVAKLKKECQKLKKLLYDKENTEQTNKEKTEQTEQTNKVATEQLCYYSIICNEHPVKNWKIHPNRVDGKYPAWKQAGDSFIKAFLSIPQELIALVKIDHKNEILDIPFDLFKFLRKEEERIG